MATGRPRNARDFVWEVMQIPHVAETMEFDAVEAIKRNCPNADPSRVYEYFYKPNLLPRVRDLVAHDLPAFPSTPLESVESACIQQNRKTAEALFLWLNDPVEAQHVRARSASFKSALQTVYYQT